MSAYQKTENGQKLFKLHNTRIYSTFGGREITG
jgi:hypothetical protein